MPIPVSPKVNPELLLNHLEHRHGFGLHRWGKSELLLQTDRSCASAPVIDLQKFENTELFIFFPHLNVLMQKYLCFNGYAGRIIYAIGHAFTT